MPMFDDPNKELNRLQEELLAEDINDDLEGLNDLLKDYEPTVLDGFREEAAADEKFSRPNTPKDLTDAMSEMLLDEDKEVQPPKVRKEKGVGGLIALCLLETAAIIGLLAWWFLCLR